MTMIAVSETVRVNAPILRRLRDGQPPESLRALARDVGRDPGNMSRTQKVLEKEGLVAGLALTAAGAAALAALDAEAGAASAAGELFVPWRDLRPNPDNPRKKARSQAVTVSRAESIAEQGVLQPLLVKPAAEDGSRIIIAGEGRYLSVGVLVEMGRAPDDYLVPCREKDVDDAGALAIALAENANREDLDQLDRAIGWLTLMEDHSVSARKLALSLNEDPRVVQEAVKVVREASAEAIAEYRAGRCSFEDLRYGVRNDGAGPTTRAADPETESDDADDDTAAALTADVAAFTAESVAQPDAAAARRAAFESQHKSYMDERRAEVRTYCATLSPRQICALVEIADKCVTDPGYPDRPNYWSARVHDWPSGGDPMRVANLMPGPLGGGWESGPKGRFVNPFDGWIGWLREQELLTNDATRDAILFKTRSSAFGEGFAHLAQMKGIYLTPWLNLDEDARAEATKIVTGGHKAGAAPSAASSHRPSPNRDAPPANAGLVVFQLRLGDFVNIGGGSVYQLLELRDPSPDRPSFRAQPWRKGKPYGQPTSLTLAAIQAIEPAPKGAS